MKHTRIIVTRYGGPDELRVVEEERPAPKRGEARVKVLAAGVCQPDIMMREGIHPETPRLPFTPGWDLVGVVDRLGEGVSGIEPGQRVAALPIHGAYAEFVCLRQGELVPVPEGLDAAEAVSLVLNYITAYQMLHRCAHVKPGQRVLIHGAAGGVDVVFDGIGGRHVWRSRKAVRRGGKVVVYGLTGALRGGRLASGRHGQRHRFREVGILGMYVVGCWFLPGRRRMAPYSIQWLKRVRPGWFRQDLMALFEMLQERKIKPLVARRIPLAEARRAHELLGEGGVTGKIVLVTEGASRQ